MTLLYTPAKLNQNSFKTFKSTVETRKKRPKEIKKKKRFPFKIVITLSSCFFMAFKDPEFMVLFSTDGAGVSLTLFKT